ncbi:MAG: peptide-methionine (S)-S-oxide reductase [Rhizobiales bacterium]|uniref:peptide-methionine (S)-S-oxide reductase MsrA n=1 Tax=unclassified Leeuwenhoekiella TaxID=2615029 RepID=UPI000C3D9B12|nr:MULTISPECIES: peptide-methionine (S)-S-oxide reductase MsrA [unclassified Leeuwenhoekiella]MAW96879.1 peptide-methionine (S)-S-oxide reductase [Leeuwenhoekiella sp.]MBA67584.1 peptide-methionine (S)-S-oxide reductase [Hyphomicrobiales bacterium]|tara:strand:+ start:376 stop:1089 length:714 start_codon:yes stop_codon:yes gene_type:complete
MKNRIIIAALIAGTLALSLLFNSCKNAPKDNTTAEVLTTANEATNPEAAQADLQTPENQNMATAYFASGCFWCVEAIYESVKGVDEAVSGYAGGHTKNPTYEESNTGRTGHAEAVKVIYDPEVVSFSQLVDVYFGSQDPTQVNGQGPDMGSQYRSIIFYQNEAEKEIIEQKKAALAEQLGEPVAAEVKPFEKFWVAEGYHQNYEKQHPENPYIQNVSIPRLNRFKAKFPELLKANSH